MSHSVAAAEPSRQRPLAEAADLAAATAVLTCREWRRFGGRGLLVGLGLGVALFVLGYGSSEPQDLTLLRWAGFVVVLSIADAFVALTVYRRLASLAGRDASRDARLPPLVAVVALLHGPLLIARHAALPLVRSPYGAVGQGAMLAVAAIAVIVLGRLMTATPTVVLEGRRAMDALDAAWRRPSRPAPVVRALAVTLVVLMTLPVAGVVVVSSSSIWTFWLSRLPSLLGFALVTEGELHWYVGRVLEWPGWSVPGLALLPLLSVPFHILAFVVYSRAAGSGS